MVNLASRIESQTKNHEAEILVSKEFWDAAKLSETNLLAGQSVGLVTVKGREAPVELIKIR